MNVTKTRVRRLGGRTVAALLAASLWSAATRAEAPPDPAERAAARAAMDALSVSSAHVPASPDEEAILAVLAARIEAGFERFDLALVEGALASDFERRLVIAEDEVLVESRDVFLAGRQGWQAAREPRRDLVYAVQQIQPTDAGLDVIAVSTWASKYFAPRFLETLSFVRAGGAWQLRSQLLVPLHPAKPGMHEVRVVATSAEAGAFFEDFNATAIAQGPDAAIDRLAPPERGGRSGRLTALAIFAEPPARGAKIELDMQFRGGSCKVYRSTRFKVEDVTPYAVFSGVGQWGGCRDIHVLVYLDGVLIAEQTVAL